MAASQSRQVQRALDGDPAAFGTVIEQYAPLVYSVLLSILRRREPLEDLAQDVFVKAWQARASLREPERISAWLAQIARRRALDWLAAEKVRAGAHDVVEHEGWIPPAEPADEQAHRQQLSQAMWQALDGLDDAARQLLLLRHVEGCSYRDIGRFLDIPTVRAYNQIRRAEKALARDVVGVLRGQGTSARSRRALAVSVLGALALDVHAAPAAAAPVAVTYATWKVAGACIGISALVHVTGIWQVGGPLASKGSGAVRTTDVPATIESARLAATSPARRADFLQRQQASEPEVQPLAEPAAAPVAAVVPTALATGDAETRPFDVRAKSLVDSLGDSVVGPTGRDALQPVALRAVRLRGAGSYSSPGNFLDDLSRFLPTCCGLSTRVQISAETYGFLDPALLASPIHFLFQGGGEAALNRQDHLRLADDERALLRRYLATGGFLYFEGDAQYLQSAAALLHEIAPPGAKLVSVSQDHPIYTAAYDLTGGFPGEHRRSAADTLWASRWELPHSDLHAAGWSALWGLEWQGRLRAVLTRSMFRNWQPDTFATRSDSLAPPIKGPLLRAAANIVVYAVALRQGAL